jgi:hypothetical protein
VREIVLDEIITPHQYLSKHFVRIARYGKKKTIEKEKAKGKDQFDSDFIDGLVAGATACKPQSKSRDYAKGATSMKWWDDYSSPEYSIEPE